MHEFAATSQVVEIVQREAEKRGAKSVTEVRLAIGKLAMLNPDQIHFAYEVLVQDTPLKGSKLIIREQEAIVECPRCRYKGPIGIGEDPVLHVVFPTLSCPHCDEVVDVIAGRECTVESVKLLLR